MFNRSWTTASVLIFAGAVPARAQMFQGLGHPFSANSAPGNNGVALIGTFQYPSLTVSRWTAGSGPVQVAAGETTINTPVGVSGDGQVVVGDGPAGFRTHAMRWTNVTGTTIDLGVLPGFSDSHVMGASADGSVAAGFCSPGGPPLRAFRWTSQTGMQSLNPLPGDDTSRAEAVSANGLVVVGASELYGVHGYVAVRWVGGSPQSLGQLPGDGSYAYASNSDGSVIVGDSTSSTATDRCFRWKTNVGMENMGILAGRSHMYANGVSDDGSVITGQCFIGGPQIAVMWTAALGWVDLNVYLPTIGIDLTGWQLYSVSVSADGRTLVGAGTHNGVNEAWVADLKFCRADFNHSGSLSVQDLLDFLAAWFALAPAADFNGVGGVTVQDIFDFLAAWFVGCP